MTYMIYRRYNIEYIRAYNRLKDTHPVLCESNRGSWSTCASNRILTISNADTPPDYDEIFHIDCFQNSVFDEG